MIRPFFYGFIMYNLGMNQENLLHDHNCLFRKNGQFCTSSIRLFHNLPPASQEYLVQKAKHFVYEKGEFLVHEGDQIEKIYIIRSGLVKISRLDPDGEEHILDILHDGQAIWHGMFLTDHIYHYSVICLTDVKLCTIHRNDFMEMLQKDPGTAMALIEMLSTELKDANDKMLLLSIRDPLFRLAGFLLEKDRSCIGSQISLKLDDIAASISLRPETVSRNIAILEKQNLIKRKGHGRIFVTDREGLKELFESRKK